MSGILLILTLALPLFAQEPMDFQYFYDEIGQLVKVVDSEGNVVQYIYDEVGNMVEIRRSTVAGLAVPVVYILLGEYSPRQLRNWFGTIMRRSTPTNDEVNEI